jgi:hypothetical protein
LPCQKYLLLNQANFSSSRILRAFSHFKICTRIALLTIAVKVSI